MGRVSSHLFLRLMVVGGILLCLAFSCAATAYADSEGVGTVSASALNMRSQPSTDASVLACLPHGTVVIVSGSSDGWYQVWYNGQSGYVSREYLSFSASGTGQFGNGTVTGDLVNIRSGPSTADSVLGQVSRSTVLPVTGVSGGYYQVTYNGTSAYISSAYLSLGGSAPAASVPSASAGVQPASGTGIITGQGVHMRSGPGTEYAIAGTYSQGVQMTVTGRAGDWYQVNCAGVTGYVYEAYLTVSSGSTAVEAMADTPAYTTTGVYLREGPSTSDPARTLLPAGTGVTMTGRAGQWVRVVCGGMTGFVHGDYLTTTAPESGVPQNAAAGDAIVAEARRYLGVRYVYGGTSPSGFDCSGFVYYVYKQCGYSVTRTATAQSRVGVQVSRSGLQPGDIIIFLNGPRSAIGHAGIALGGGKFIHASSGGGRVMISSLSESYYNTRFYSARRVV